MRLAIKNNPDSSKEISSQASFIYLKKTHQTDWIYLLEENEF
jgi:hypothetical protein